MLPRSLVIALLAALVALGAPAPPPAAAQVPAPLTAPMAPAPYTDAGYFTFADRMTARLEAAWSDHAGYYRGGNGGVEPMLNASMLTVFSVAALRGYAGGPSRNDARARTLAARLVASPPFVTIPSTAGRGSQAHAPGWVNTMNSPNSIQHLVFDAEVVDGLTYAFRARDALALPPATVAAIANAIHLTAQGTFWRYPALRVNQFSWYATMYYADALVTNQRGPLVRGLAGQLARFVRGARGSAGGGRAGNFGPGLRFHYLPGRPVSSPLNIDSAEYANVVLSFTRYWANARALGIPAPSTGTRRLLGQWIERALAGYWTHSGYLNWDSGLGFNRWHQAKKLGLTQEALIGIASAPELSPGPQWPRYAKYFLDRGLELYDKLSLQQGGGIPSPVLFDVSLVPQGEGSANLAASRMAANAARAIDAGLGTAAVARPPALYAWDPDTGRLAVTTRAYNTAVLPVNQRAFPYGGLDLARLFDSGQEVAANIGGTPPASFGLTVSDSSGHRALATQVGRHSVSRSVTPLRLTRAPSGVGIAASTRQLRAYAGRFDDLRATGTVRSSRLAARVTHRFTPSWIETRWDLVRRTGRKRYSAYVAFPSWRGEGDAAAASVTAVLRDGRSVALGSGRVSLRQIAYFWVRSQRSGYVVVPLRAPAGATARARSVRAQGSQPRPGPSLAIGLFRAKRFNAAALDVRMAIAHDPAEAATVEARLR